ncbi:FAD-linked oxidoreductase [Lactarius akahatsu]|uniref:Proline dehydrogenase n=1 Tax=Lactarius akahatsu TaxID=416441 RepID=A0AAD4LDW6_9AGAM|nr:FAD-linked oxidoreductase [Lactarius akahatsu]
MAGGGALAASFALGYTVYTDASLPSTERAPTPLSKLVTSYVVYSLCSIPGLVDASPTLLAFCTSIPGLRQLTEAFVRATFFTQFVGGSTALSCIPLIRQLRAENKGALFAYSVEADADDAASGARSLREPVHKRIVQEMIRSINVAADFEDSRARADESSGRRTWVAIKLSALLPNPNTLLHLSAHLSSFHATDPVLFPGCPRADDLAVLKSNDLPSSSPLTAQDLADLGELLVDLNRICSRARERNVRLIVDAEYSWYQPAIDSISLSLMREFNKDPPSSSRWFSHIISRPARTVPPPLIYVTFQAYLRRTPEYLTQSLQDAISHHYALGVKLVRGAYHEQEAQSDSPSLPLTAHVSWPPVFLNKADTDRCYDAAAGELVRAVANSDGSGPRVGVLFGSHNAGSCAKVLDALVNAGLATHEKDGTVKVDDVAAERVALAQLYGMSDTLTDSLAASVRTRAPFVIKYVPYGALSEVMPYLSRRAIENKSVLGNGHAAVERKQAFDAIWRHFFG